MNRRKLMYFLKQKLCGLVIAGFGILIPFVLDGDATASVLLIPWGLYIIFTREHLMEF